MAVLSVEIEALRRDAKMWGGGEGSMEDTMRTAASTAGGLELGGVHLSWAAEDAGLVQIYEQIRLKAVRLMNEGAANFGSISGTLAKAANVFDGTDHDNAESIYSGWQPKTSD